MITVFVNMGDINSEDAVLTSNSMNSIRTSMIFVIQFTLVELFYRVRVIDFFAGFVSQLEKIINDSLPLLTMLVAIVLTQGMLFFLNDQN